MVSTLPSTTLLPAVSRTQEEKSTSTDWLLVVALANASRPPTKDVWSMLPARNLAAAFIMPVYV